MTKRRGTTSDNGHEVILLKKISNFMHELKSAILGNIHVLRKRVLGIFDPPPSPPLCVQMDFMRTFEANTKCNNINYV